jgi:hypothetical protein
MVARARITKIDSTSAKAYPGVIAVITTARLWSRLAPPLVGGGAAADLTPNTVMRADPLPAPRSRRVIQIARLRRAAGRQDRSAAGIPPRQAAKGPW